VAAQCVAMISALLSLLSSGAGWLMSVCWAACLWLFSPLPLAVIAVTLYSLYYYLTKDYAFWSRRGVSGPPPKFPWGMKLKEQEAVTEIDRQLYYDYGGKRFCGFMEIHRPVLSLGDLDLIRAVTVKDFEHFTDRRQFIRSEDMRLMLTALRGQEWKARRATMTPAFSASKLKGMHQLCLDNAANLVQYIRDETARKGELELKDCFGRFTMDNIASCAFGINSNSFNNPEAEFAKHTSTLFKPFKGWALVRVLLVAVFSEWFLKLPDPIQPSIDFLKRVVKTTIQHRDQSNSSRRDFLQLLLEARDKDGNRLLSDDSLVTQSMMFLFAGYDTTATLLTYAGFSLASYPDVQRQVQEEIDAVLERHGGQLTYDAVMEMTYLDRVLSETLRLYSPASRLERESTKDYTLPGTNVNLPKGTLVQIPVFMVHRDPEHYPDPEKFDPDRFLPEEKEKRHPCAWMPFGSGPRNCIAMRFALFEAKLALVAVLKELTLQPTETTPPPPMPLDKKGFLTTPQGRKMPLKAVLRAKEL